MDGKSEETVTAAKMKINEADIEGQGRRPGGTAARGLFPRLVAVVERALEKARDQAEDSEHTVAMGWVQLELEEIEGFLRAGKATPGPLSPEAMRELARAKERRRTLRRFVYQSSRHAEENSAQWGALMRDAEHALRRAPRLEGERERLRVLLAALEPIEVLLHAADHRTVAAAKRRMAELEELAASEAGPTTAPAGEEVAAQPEPSFESYLPAASEVEFDPEDSRIVARLTKNEFDRIQDYHLNLTAQHLSLVSGFEVLLCLPLLRGVEEYPFQVNTARQVLRTMRGRALLCDEVGLGKTIEAGLILKEYSMRGLARKVLVLTPPALVSQWEEEMQDKFGLDFVTHEDPEFRALGAAAWERFDRVIASLHTAKSAGNSAAIHRLAYDLIIVDEAHHLRNRATVNWKFVNEVKSKYLLLLTATPAQNNLDELFNLITLLSPGQLKTPSAFRREFVERGDPRKPKNRTKLRELLMDVMVRNTRSQVSIALPPRRAFTLRVRLSPGERALYDAVTRFVRSEYHGRSTERFIAHTLQAEVGSSAQALRATLASMVPRDPNRCSALEALCDQAAAVTASAKAEALLKTLSQWSEKVLVFTKYRETQQFVLKALEQAGVPAAAFSGAMSASQKDEQVAAFARDRQVLVSTDVGSEGRNLQFCHTLVNYDLPWNPMKIEQRVGRVHRIGQKEPVHILNLAAHDTVEDYILEVLDSKINMFELVVGEVGEILGNLDEEREFDDLVLDLWVSAESNEAARQAFVRLGDQLVEAQRKYLTSKAYDEALFEEDFTAEEV